MKIDKESYTNDEEHRIIIAINDVVSTLTGRNPSYKIPPASYIDIEILIAQMVLKAERARQAVDDERRIDEVRDTAGYAILILGRLLSDIAVPMVNDNILSDEEVAVHNKKLQHYINIDNALSELKMCNQHRGGKTDKEFSMYSDGYHQALKDRRHMEG